MRKLVAVLALAATAFASSASAAVLNFNFAYQTIFAESVIEPDAELGLTTGSLVTGSASFDDSLISAGEAQLTGAPSTFSLSFGSRTLGIDDDLFGGPVVLVGPGDSFAGLLFEAEVMGATAEYLITFNGNGFVVDYAGGTGSSGPLASGAEIPEPSTYALLVAGLAMLGFMARRRQI